MFFSLFSSFKRKISNGQNSKISFSVLVAFLLIITTFFGFFNLVFFPKTVLAQNLNSLEKINQNPEISQETAFADINLVEQNTNSIYKFGDRIEIRKFDKNQIKNDLCGQNIDFSSSQFGSKFDQKAGISVIKTLKTKCQNFPNSNSISSSQISSWFKLVWDNGLIGWVLIPEIQNVNQNFFQSSSSVSSLNSNSKTTSNLENLLKIGGVQTLAQTNTGLKKTCSDFQFQVRDLSLLNQFPNLDLDDDGVGCEHLKINPIDQIISNISDLDTDKNGKITCNDFVQKIYDSIILSRFPNLDADKDGIGCENNKVNPNYKSGEAFDNSNSEDFVDIENLDFELTLDENTVDLGDLTQDLSQVLNSDWQYLEANDHSCGKIFCLIKSLSGLGRKGLWTFHFVAGVLQGAGQSVVDLLGQIWNLVTKTGEVVSEIINSIKALFSDSKLLLKLLQDSMLELLKTDTMGRANLIGKAVGQFVPDVVLAVLTAGAASIAKSSLTALKISTKFASTVIKFEKFVGRTIRILNGKYQFLLKKVRQGIGIAGREVAKFAREMADSEFAQFLGKVTKISEKRIIEGLRKGLKNCVFAHNTNNLILAFFTGVEVEAAGICTGWTDYLKSILTNEKWKSLPLDIKTPGKINFKPPLNKSKIPLIKKGPNKGILDEFSNEWNWHLLHKDHYDVTLPNGKHFGVYPDGTFKASKEVPKPPTKIVN